MTPVEDLSENARKVLFVILDEFRKKLMPDWAEERFRRVALFLIEKELARIVETPEGFRFLLTPEGWRALFLEETYGETLRQ